MTNEANVIEAILLRWGENHSSGRTVTFQLPEDEGAHPFKHLKCGPSHGQRVALSIALINDDESRELVTEEQPKQRRSFHELPYSQQASMLCNEAVFCRFLEEYNHSYDGPPMDADEAAHIVRDICDVSSRRELDTNDKAACHWCNLYSKYKAWEAVG